MNTLFTHNTLLEGKDDSWYLLMAQFPRMAGESGLVDRSVISLAATFLAKKTNNTPLIRHGVEIYNSAIAGLARMLKRNCRPTLEMFYAMIIFHTYEVRCIRSLSAVCGSKFNFTVDANRWRCHAQLFCSRPGRNSYFETPRLH